MFVLTSLVLLFYWYFILFYVILYYSVYRLCVYVYKPLPPGVYPIAVGKYININILSTYCQFIIKYRFRLLTMYIEISESLKASLPNAILNNNYYEISSPPFKYRYQGISTSVVKIIFPRVKRSEREADPSIPSSAQVNMLNCTCATHVQLQFDV
jgi:hypothetical protein